eukprot:TRINITY_DN13663_c0_g1_i1.p1 TRINITY_DN13663_c0_g1~~TRINITY_DN13663_c0_g1_i1.p1  ORF type:complete len:162 (-),score=28.44 TRINITY_DN13663_c0_g1_i1:21-482(-)
MADNRLNLIVATSATSFLLFKQVLTNFYGASSRGAAGLRLSEDDGFFELAPEAKMEEAIEFSKRCDRVTLNDLENIPIGLAIIWGTYLALKEGNMEAKSFPVLVGLFCALRAGHTVSYLNKFTIGRSICHLVGLVTLFSLGGLGIYSAVKSKQ